MFTASLSHHIRPVGTLLGGSGIRRIAEHKKPNVGALLEPHATPCDARSMPMDSAGPPWEADCHDLDRNQAAAIVIAVAMDDPEFVLEKIQQLKQSGEIALDELVQIEDIARKWIKIARYNREKGRP